MIPIRKEAAVLSTFVIAVALMVFGSAPAWAQQGPEIRVTDSETRADQPDVAIDSAGNVHIVYCDEYNTSYREIWYTMLDNDGNTLIEDTMLTDDDGYESTRPGIVIDSDDNVHITWRDQRYNSGSYQEVAYTKIDPSLDDQSGDAADPATITVVDDTRLSDVESWYMFGIRMAVDSNDDIHIVWDDYDQSYIYYMKIDKDGVELVAETVIRDASQWRALPDIAIDSNDNLHVTWADYGDTSYDELYYMMLDNDGVIMIDATLLTDDDSYYSKWASIVVDYEDKVHIVFQDQRGDDHEIYYTKIDPALDDQSGDAADGAAITVIDDTALTPDDDEKSRHPAVAIYQGRYIHITWDENDLGPDVGFIMLDNDGTELVARTTLTTTGTAEPSTYWTMPYLEMDANGTAHIVWSDTRGSKSRTYNEVYYTTYTYTEPTCDDGIQNGDEVGIDCGGTFCPACLITPIVEPEAISTGGDEETPVVVVDADGNAHVLWASDEGTYLYYKMVDFDGDVVIDEMSLNPCAAPDSYHVRRPSAVIDSSGVLHVVFHGFSLYTDLGATEYAAMTVLTASEVIYTKLDPGAYLAGGSADINDLVVVEETIISTDDGAKSRAPNMAIAGDTLHLAWYDGSDNSDLSINYISLDLDGVEVFAEDSLVTGLNVDIDWGEPGIAMDPDGNAHIVYCTDLDAGDDYREIYYIMVDGATGDVLIDATRITADDDESSVRPQLAVDGSGMVHVVWHDRRLYVEPPKGKAPQHEIYYSKLNPGLDDQDGSAADPTVISLIAEALLSSNNEKKSNQKNIFIDKYGWVHVVWADGEEYTSERDVYYAIFNTSGAAVTEIEAETLILAGNDLISPICWWYSSSRHPVLAVFAGRAFVAFNVYDIVGDTSDIYLGIFGYPIPKKKKDDGCGCAVFDSQRDIGPGQFAAFGLLALVPFAFVVVLRRRMNR